MAARDRGDWMQQTTRRAAAKAGAKFFCKTVDTYKNRD
jgi:hypothetical protein